MSSSELEDSKLEALPSTCPLNIPLNVALKGRMLIKDVIDNVQGLEVGPALQRKPLNIFTAGYPVNLKKEL